MTKTSVSLLLILLQYSSLLFHQIDNIFDISIFPFMELTINWESLCMIIQDPLLNCHQNCFSHNETFCYKDGTVSSRISLLSKRTFEQLSLIIYLIEAEFIHNLLEAYTLIFIHPSGRALHRSFERLILLNFN